MRDIKAIIVHCSDTATGTVQGIKTYHTAPPPFGRGWSDIGYHWIISQDGVVHPGRPEATPGAHCENHNFNTLGICLIGVDEHSFTLIQLEALRKLLKEKMAEYKIDSSKVYGHYETDTGQAQGKTCPNLPGLLIRAFLKD